MRVLHVIDSLNIGGAEKLLIETVPLLVGKNIEVDVVLLNGEKTDFYKKLEEYSCCNIVSLGNKYYSLGYFFKLYNLVKGYDFIHVHLFPAQYYVAVLKIFGLVKGKLVFTEHSTLNRRLKNKMFRSVEKIVYNQYHNIICITNEVKRNLSSLLSIDERKLLVLENGVNITQIRLSVALDRKLQGFLDTDVLIIMVAGFRREKDQDTVIRTLVDLPTNYKLLLVGDGDRKEVLENLVNSLYLKERVSFLGIRSDVYNLIKMCDIAVLSSHWEGFGLSAVESMASGIPLIASNVDGLAQVVEDGGILFERGSESDLYDKILGLEDESYYQEVCEKGRVKAKQYDINTMVDKLIAMYERL